MRRLWILFFTVAVIFSTASFSYGESVSLRDGQIDFELPNGWEDMEPGEHDQLIQEYYGDTAEELENYGDETSELLLLKYKEFAGMPATVELLYDNDPYGQIDFTDCDEADLAEYFEDYGYEWIDSTLLPQGEHYREITRDEQLLEAVGSGDIFVQANVKEETEIEKSIQYRVYYTVKNNCVITILLTCYGDEVPDQMEAEATQMVTGFSDDGYYNVYDGAIYEDDEGLWEEDDSSGGVGVFFLLAALVPLVTAGINLLNKNEDKKSAAASVFKKVGDSGSQAESAPVEASQPAPAQKTQPVSVSQKPSKPAEQIRAKASKFYPLKADGKVVQVRSTESARPSKAKTADESYLGSLKTLLDSGLLTKEQYREMVEKHKREH